MIGSYPRSMAELGSWAADNHATGAEARQRFAQYVILCGIASAPLLREGLVFKGGNALDFVWQANRSTIDLDFSVDMEGVGFEIGVEGIRRSLEQAFRGVSNRFGVALAVHSVRQQPPGADKLFITYRANVGYGLSDEPRLVQRMSGRQPSPHVIPIEISINEPIGESARFQINEQLPSLRVSTLEDIVGEKLRSLLQQTLRNRHRRQDVLDIAVIVRDHPELDTAKIASYLLIKAQARDVPVSRSAFHNPDIRARAQVDYAALQPTTRVVFIPFEEAFALVLGLVGRLELPE